MKVTSSFGACFSCRFELLLCRKKVLFSCYESPLFICTLLVLRCNIMLFPVKLDCTIETLEACIILLNWLLNNGNCSNSQFWDSEMERLCFLIHKQGEESVVHLKKL